MIVTTDLHLHSKYSRAVSPQMNLSTMAAVARQKGLNLLATGDWTHPLWFREIGNSLEEVAEGIYGVKNYESRIMNQDQRIASSFSTPRNDVKFLLSVEMSCIYSQGGKGRRVHNLVFVPSLSSAEKINKELTKRGYNLSADGRPIIGLSSKHLLELILSIDERSLLIPAHVWTPWFGVYGMRSGFNSLQECFEELTPYVYGIETGLSSDPEMNWEIEELNTRSILSFSDAHSLPKMGREATVFELENLTYENVRKAIMAPSMKNQAFVPSSGRGESGIMNQGKNAVISNVMRDPQGISHPLSGFRNDKNRVLYTVEFYPEEGKYHYSGHRNCHVLLTPEQQEKVHGICPVCTRSVTDGVMRRVAELANVESRITNHELRVRQEMQRGVAWLVDPQGIHPPFLRLVPLNEIIAEAIGSPVASPKVIQVFDMLVQTVGSELFVLLEASLEDIKKALVSHPYGSRITEGIAKVREGNITIVPGYDGVYGTVSIWKKGEDTQKAKRQLGLEL